MATFENRRKIPVLRLTEPRYSTPAAFIAALLLLTAWSWFVTEYREHIKQSPEGKFPYSIEEELPDTAGKKIRLLVHLDMEPGTNTGGPAGTEARGFRSDHSFKLTSDIPFSPGLHITFRDLLPGDTSWLLSTAMVWFEGNADSAECSLVTTCNHRGTNYKYSFLPLETRSLVPLQWNKVSLAYRIPEAIDPGDLVQVYFWYRGKSEMFIDDFMVVTF